VLYQNLRTKILGSAHKILMCAQMAFCIQD